ncbi:hypothetical protein NHJ6243_000547 [Beauveria neobassiana]
MASGLDERLLGCYGYSAGRPKPPPPPPPPPCSTTPTFTRPAVRPRAPGPTINPPEGAPYCGVKMFSWGYPPSTRATTGGSNVTHARAQSFGGALMLCVGGGFRQ